MLMQGSQGQAGKQVGQNLTLGFGEYSDALVTELQPRYYQQNYRGNVYFLNASAVTATAYTGGAAGTPLLGVMNPLGSGKNLVFIGATIGNRAAASAAGVVTFNVWGGPSTNPTGTQTNPTNMLSLTASGAVSRGFINTAMTGSTALNQIMPIGTYYWATAASALLSPVNSELAGSVIAIPGNMIALGATAALTSATWDATLIWAEIPV
jgi:hypothetical protein